MNQNKHEDKQCNENEVGVVMYVTKSSQYINSTTYVFLLKFSSDQ